MVDVKKSFCCHFLRNAKSLSCRIKADGILQEFCQLTLSQQIYNLISKQRKPRIKVMEKFSGIFSLVLLSLLVFLNSFVFGDEINFYDDNGSFSMIRTIGYGGCYKFAPVWDKRATAIDIVEERSCFNVWKTRDCSGDHLKLTKKEGSYELRSMNFDKAISSVSLCTWDDQGRPDPMSRLPNYNINRPVYQPIRQEGEHFGGGRMRGELSSIVVPVNTREVPSYDSYRRVQFPTDNVETKTLITPSRNSNPSNIQESTSSSDDVREFAVQEHNKYRREHGAKDLTGNNQIHQDAQTYAESMASTNKLEATTYGNRYASNVATSFRRSKIDSVKDAISRWFNKSNLNEYELEATEMGIGAAWNEREKLWVIVAFYHLPDIYFIEKFHKQTGGNIPSGRPLRMYQ